MSLHLGRATQTAASLGRTAQAAFLRRIRTRTTNDYGKSVEDRNLVLQHLSEIEPLLRATCTHEIDAAQPVDEVVQQLIAIGKGDRRR